MVVAASHPTEMAVSDQFAQGSPVEVETRSSSSASTEQHEQDSSPIDLDISSSSSPSLGVSLPVLPRQTEFPRRLPRPQRLPARALLRTTFRKLTTTATVIVGDSRSPYHQETTYTVHKGLLTGTSPFFAAALDGRFSESRDQIVRLPEERPESFEWFLQWLYTGALTTQPCSAEPASHPPARPYNVTVTLSTSLALPDPTQLDAHLDGDLRNAQGSPKYFLLIDLYFLSDRLLTTPFSNHILSTIARLSEITNSVPTPSDTWILYADDQRHATPLHALVLDLFAYKKTDRLLASHRDNWHTNFLRDLVVKLKRPGPEALERHGRLIVWSPQTWAVTRGCDVCRAALSPEVEAHKCPYCEKVFCANCLRRAVRGLHKGGSSFISHDPSGCKPWMGKGMCARYHEHGAGEACA